jgi:hypothetical protein
MSLGLDSATIKKLMWSLSCGLLLSFSGFGTSGCFGTGGKKDKTEEVSEEEDGGKMEDTGKKKGKKKAAKKKGKKKADPGKGSSESTPPAEGDMAE